MWKLKKILCLYITVTQRLKQTIDLKYIDDYEVNVEKVLKDLLMDMKKVNKNIYHECNIADHVTITITGKLQVTVITY
jgi:hypothetical protein